MLETPGGHDTRKVLLVLPHSTTPIGVPSKFESTEHLIPRAAELYGKPRCLHSSATLVQHIDDEYGWFACYQCDKCGTITRLEVTADDLDRASNAPWLDMAMYEQATTERLPGETLGKTLAFFGKAAK